MRIPLVRAVVAAVLASGATAQEGARLPDCAVSGAASVMIGGRPALRLSDVANCPAELYEVVPSIRIEGQPVIRFRTGTGARGSCTAAGDPSVRFEGRTAPRIGDVDCRGR